MRWAEYVASMGTMGNVVASVTKSERKGPLWRGGIGGKVILEWN
jgi:hypothetical protein